MNAASGMCSSCQSSSPLAAACSSQLAHQVGRLAQELLVVPVLCDPTDELVELDDLRVGQLGHLVGHERRELFRVSRRHQDPGISLGLDDRLRCSGGTQAVQVVDHLFWESQRIAGAQLRDPPAVLLERADLRT